MPDRPFVVLSAAMSADGYIDDASPSRLVLSDAADLDEVDQLRADSDAILVGAQTIRSDNPRLAVRSAARRARRRQLGLPSSPRKVTVTASGGLDPSAAFFADSDTMPLVYTPARMAGYLAARLGGGAEVTALPPGAPPGRIRAAAGGVREVAAAGDVPGSAARGGAWPDLGWMLADLAARGVSRLLVEGGACVLAQFLSAGLADEFRLAVAPVFVADPQAPRLLRGRLAVPRLVLAQTRQAGGTAVLTYLLSDPSGE